MAHLEIIGITKHLGAVAAIPQWAVDAHFLDLRDQCTLAHEVPDERQHEGPDQSALGFRDIDAVCIGRLYLAERFNVTGCLGSELVRGRGPIVEEQAKDFREVRNRRAPHVHVAAV